MNIAEELDIVNSKFRKSYEEKRKKISQELNLLFQDYIDPISLIANEDDIEVSYNRVKNCKLPPQLMHIGTMQQSNSTNNPSCIPCLINYMRSCATLFIGGINKDFDFDTLNLFQLITLRVLGTIHFDQLNFIFFDTKSFGRKFNIIGKLHEDIRKRCDIIDDSSKIDGILKKLENIVRKSALEMNNIVWLDEYNQSSDTSYPYTFVFISDLPNGFSSDDRARLLRLIDDCNATKAGIYIFISSNIDPNTKDNPIKSKYDDLSEYLDMIKSKCQTISYLNDNDVIIENDQYIYDQSINDLYDIQIDKSSNNQIIDSFINSINEIIDFSKQKQISSLENSYYDKLKTNIWTKSSIDGLSFKIGYLENGNPFTMTFANGSSDYFAAIGGRPGSGKTILIHNIILSGSINYSPEELQFYLFDYANGTSFIGYEKLPHVKVLSITKEREYGVSTLKSVFDEMEHRSILFKEAAIKSKHTISKYEDYRQITKDSLPRIVIIIDEFQVLTSNNDKLSNIASKSIESIIKESRKFGIHIILCTQKYSGIDVDISLITQRIAFNLSSIDSEKLLGNNAANSIDQVGYAIANNMNGDKEKNILFRSMMFNNISEIVDKVASISDKLMLSTSRRLVFDSIIESDITMCRELVDILHNYSEINHPKIYLGSPKYLSDKDVSITLKNTYKSNILYIGHDQEASVRSILISTFQILLQSSRQSHIYIINNLNSSDPTFKYDQQLKSKPNNVTFHNPQELEVVIDEVYDKLQTRLESISTLDLSRIILTGINLDSLRQFRENKISYSNEKVDTKSKLIEIIKNGPDFNIHTILHVTSTNSLINMLGNSNNIELFAFRIISKGIQDIRGISNIRAEDLPKKSNHCYLHVEDSVEASKLMFNPDPFVAYNKQSTNSTEYIDSIINLFN